MRIAAPEISQIKNHHVLSSRIETEDKGIHLPQSMWFAINTPNPLFAPGLTDAFLVSLITVAMKLGEDIQVEGKVSSRLAHGLETYQNIMGTWWPKVFKIVDVNYESLEDRREELRPLGVASTFSGGLDSFHSVAELLPSHNRNSAFNITHALMINGFDQFVDLEHRGLSQKMFRNYFPALAEWGVELLMLDTNMRQFRSAVLNRTELINSYGSSLAACAHALASLFGRFGIAGHDDYSYEALYPYGSHPVLDPLLSSDQLQIIHAGSAMSRSAKLEQMAESPLVQKNLMVCFGVPSFHPRTGGPVNCGRCEKCIRTKVGLIILNKLDFFTTFPVIYPLEQYQHQDVLKKIDSSFLADLAGLAKRHGQTVWVEKLEAAMKTRILLEKHYEAQMSRE